MRTQFAVEYGLKRGSKIVHGIDQLSTREDLLPTGSEERGVLGVGSIPVAILPSCQETESIAL